VKKNKKSFIWPQGVLLALVGLAATLTLGFMSPIKPNISIAQIGGQTIKGDSAVVQVPTQERVEQFKTQMLNSWQLEANAKGVVYDLPSRFKGATIADAKLNPSQKVVALTFDDGPWPKFSDQVMDILKENNIKGTFFVVGRNMKSFPEIGKRIVAEGHVIANHTYHHWYHFMNPQVAASEIDNTANEVYKVTGVKTNLFRPPGGIMTNGVVNYAKNQKYAVVMWSSDSIDYSRPPVARLVSNVMREAKPGGIVLMHDGGGDRTNTVRALPIIIENFRKQGYRFVTVPELLELQDKDSKLMTATK
jgi:peptidoglycan-N-acetylglucosamine deacetylase